MSFEKFLVPLRFVIALFACTLGSAFTGFGQNANFEGDSIYYTPISKTPPPTVDRNVGIFRDTTRHDRFAGYYFDVSIGTLGGCNDCFTGTELTFSTSTTHGVTLGKKTRAGIGIGFDTYFGWQTVPMFGSVSYDLAGTKNTHAVFIQGQYGWSFAWHETLQYELPSKDVQGGTMFGVFAGYRVRYHNLRISILAGFKQQLATTIYERETWIPSETGVMVPGTPSRTTIETTMGRAAFNLALSWK
ncbi:MAG: hypothetical protein QM762_30390 [Chryseolinea sp.]